jgi:salicylate hydroxylase
MPEAINAAIAGGGIGGLSAALALSRQGIETHLYERRPEFPEEGAGIQIGPNGTRILRDLGVADELQKTAVAPEALSVRDATTGYEITRLPLGDWIEKRHGAPYWTATRSDLHRALRRCTEAEPRIMLNRGVEITGFVEEDAGVRAESANRTVTHAAFLVAADGLWSCLRRNVMTNNGMAEHKPNPVGKSAYRSVIPLASFPSALDPKSIHIWLAPRAHVVHYPVSAGREIAIVVITPDLSHDIEWSKPAAAEAVNGKVRSFAVPLRSLIASGQGWRHWALHDMQPLRYWTAGHVALLGDAAHPVLPFLAQGAVMALEDSVSLAAYVADARDNIPAALRAYAESRRLRVMKVADASRRSGRIYHMLGLAAHARNTVMKVLPAPRVMAGFDWRYGGGIWPRPGGPPAREPGASRPP